MFSRLVLHGLPISPKSMDVCSRLCPCLMNDDGINAILFVSGEKK